MIQLHIVDEYRFCAHAMQSSKRLLFGRVLDDHSDHILEYTDLVDVYPNPFDEELHDVCIKKLCSGYPHGFSSPQRASSWAGAKTLGMDEHDTALLFNSISVRKSTDGQKFSSQSCLKLYKRAYFKIDCIYGKLVSQRHQMLKEHDIILNIQSKSLINGSVVEPIQDRNGLLSFLKQ